MHAALLSDECYERGCGSPAGLGCHVAHLAAGYIRIDHGRINVHESRAVLAIASGPVDRDELAAQFPGRLPAFLRNERAASQATIRLLSVGCPK